MTPGEWIGLAVGLVTFAGLIAGAAWSVAARVDSSGERISRSVHEAIRRVHERIDAIDVHGRDNHSQVMSELARLDTDIRVQQRDHQALEGRVTVLEQSGRDHG